MRIYGELAKAISSASLKLRTNVTCLRQLLVVVFHQATGSRLVDTNLFFEKAQLEDIDTAHRT